MTEAVAARGEHGPRLARKIAITAVTGLVTFFVSVTLENQLDFSIAELLIFTAIVGSVTLLTQFLVEFADRLGDLEEKQDTRLTAMKTEQQANIGHARTVIQDGFARISDATELYTALEKSALHTDALTQLVRWASRISDSSPRIARDLAQAEIGRVSALLKSLSEGNEVIYDGEDQEYLLGLACSAEHSISATSLATVDAGAAGIDGGFWTSDLGRRYLEAQRQAAEDRHVTVRRIFVFDRPFPGDRGFESIRALQSEARVEVRVLESTMVPERLKAGIFDFIVFDRAICYETMAATPMDEGRAPAIVTTRLVLDEQWVKRRVDRFEALWEAAREFEPQAGSAVPDPKKA